jgi:hypothetical protein
MIPTIIPDLYRMEKEPSNQWWKAGVDNDQVSGHYGGDAGLLVVQKDIVGHLVSRHSISATRGPRDIISSVIHKMGITFGSYLGTCARCRVHENHNISW